MKISLREIKELDNYIINLLGGNSQTFRVLKLECYETQEILITQAHSNIDLQLKNLGFEELSKSEFNLDDLKYGLVKQLSDYLDINTYVAYELDQDIFNFNLSNYIIRY